MFRELMIENAKITDPVKLKQQLDLAEHIKKGECASRKVWDGHERRAEELAQERALRRKTSENVAAACVRSMPSAAAAGSGNKFSLPSVGAGVACGARLPTST